MLKTRDSLHVRYTDGINYVDISIEKKGRIYANTYIRLVKINKEYQSEGMVFRKRPLGLSIARAFLDTLYALGIPDFCDSCKIPGYSTTLDGTSYIFKISNKTMYKQFM